MMLFLKTHKNLMRNEIMELFGIFYRRSIYLADLFLWSHIKYSGRTIQVTDCSLHLLIC